MLLLRDEGAWQPEQLQSSEITKGGLTDLRKPATAVISMPVAGERG